MAPGGAQASGKVRCGPARRKESFSWFIERVVKGAFSKERGDRRYMDASLADAVVVVSPIQERKDALDKATHELPKAAIHGFGQAAALLSHGQAHLLLPKVRPGCGRHSYVCLDQFQDALVKPLHKSQCIVWADMAEPVVAHELQANNNEKPVHLPGRFGPSGVSAKFSNNINIGIGNIIFRPF